MLNSKLSSCISCYISDLILTNISEHLLRTCQYAGSSEDLIKPRGGSNGKESAYNTGDLGLIPGLGRAPGGGNGYALQHSCLENPMDREALGSPKIGHH